MAEEYRTEYQHDLFINKDKLDEELIVQAELYMKWSERWADAMLKRDKVKENLDIVRAKIDKEIRDNPESYGFDSNKKPTETAIGNAIINEEDYKNANTELAEANYEINILSVAREAMSHKKKALEKLVDLWLAGYFGDVKISSNKSMDIRQKKINERSTRRKI